MRRAECLKLVGELRHEELLQQVVAEFLGRLECRRAGVGVEAGEQLPRGGILRHGRQIESAREQLPAADAALEHDAELVVAGEVVDHLQHRPIRGRRVVEDEQPRVLHQLVPLPVAVEVRGKLREQRMRADRTAGPWCSASGSGTRPGSRTPAGNGRAWIAPCSPERRRTRPSSPRPAPLSPAPISRRRPRPPAAVGATFAG